MRREPSRIGQPPPVAPLLALGRRAAVIAVLLAATAGAEAEHAALLDKGKWRKVPVRTPRSLAGFRPARGVPLSQYGGLATRKVKPTGFFRVEKTDGRWWLVDPEGCLFLSAGLCSVNLSTSHDSPGKFTTKETWAEATAELLREHGFNTLGRWSEWELFRQLDKPMAYCGKLSMMSSYKNVRDPKRGERGYPHQTMPVFDPEFEAHCDEHARQLAATKDDPWLLGHFSDNELPFRPNALDNFLKLPASDPGRQAAADFLTRRGRTAAKATEADEAAFAELVSDRYYRIVARAIKRHDPNHLFLGSRLHGRCITEPVFRGARHCDVVSVNYYHRWSAEPERMTRWLRASGRPFIASEWYAMSLDTPTRDVRGAGFRVQTDRDRGLFYQNFTLSLLEHPSCVGWHWFKYGGDAPGCHKGVVSPQLEPHRELLAPMKELNDQLYPLARHLLRPRR